MKKLRHLFALLAVTVLCSAQYVDRVVASVNGTPILWSDVEEEVRVEALLEGTPLSKITLQQRNAALNRLIDTTLMERQIREAHASVDSAEMSDKVSNLAKSLKAQRNAASNDQAWQALLQEYGLTQNDLDEHLKRQINILNFIDLRFRSGAQVTPQQVEEYYRTKFVPDMKKRGATPPVLDAVRPQIERILLEQSVSESMDQWLKAVRGQAEIWRAEPFASMDQDDKGRD